VKLSRLTLAAACVLAAQTPTKSVWDGVYSSDQSKRGQSAYASQCASCHGAELTGGESAPPLAGAEFLSNWNGLTVGDLFDRTRSSMPANKPGSMTREMTSDIIAFILSANQFPAGKTEMAHAGEMLKDIRIDAQKPEGK